MNEAQLQELIGNEAGLNHVLQIRLTSDQLTELDEFVESVNAQNNANLNRSKVVRVALAGFLEGLREAETA